MSVINPVISQVTRPVTQPPTKPPKGGKPSRRNPRQPNLNNKNLILDSNDLRTSGPNWTAINSPTITFNQTGLEGAANTASLVTSAGSGSIDQVHQTVTLSGTKSIVTVRVWLKHYTGYAPWIQLNFSGDGTTNTYATFGTSATVWGVAGYQGTASPGTEVLVARNTPSGWNEYVIGVVQNNNYTSLRVVFSPSVSATIGSAGDGTSAESQTVGNVECYDGLSPWEVVGQDPEFN